MSTPPASHRTRTADARTWHPLTPLAIAVFATVFAYTGPQPWAPLVSLVLALVVAVSSGTSLATRVLALAAGVGLPTFALLFLMNGIVAPEDMPVRSVGPLEVALDAAAPAAAIALRLAAAIAALGWMVLVVSPRALARALADRGLPAWAAYVLVASLDAVPQAQRRAREVLDAQRARGMRVRSGVARIRSLLPAAGPLVVSLVGETEERALALEARGFRPWGRRTALDPLRDRPAERALRVALWLAALSAVVWRFTVGAS